MRLIRVGDYYINPDDIGYIQKYRAEFPWNENPIRVKLVVKNGPTLDFPKGSIEYAEIFAIQKFLECHLAIDYPLRREDTLCVCGIALSQGGRCTQCGRKRKDLE